MARKLKPVRIAVCLLLASGNVSAQPAGWHATTEARPAVRARLWGLPQQGRPCRWPEKDKQAPGPGLMRLRLR